MLTWEKLVWKIWKKKVSKKLNKCCISCDRFLYLIVWDFWAPINGYMNISRVTPVSKYDCQCLTAWMTVNGWLCEYNRKYFTIISPCLCRHMCLWRVHLLWRGSLRRLGWHPWRHLRVWREKLPCHVRQILGWFLFRWSTSWNMSVKLPVLIITFVLYILNV